MSFQHSTLADGRWQKLSLAEQLGNIGSEVGRTERFMGGDEENFKRARDRALELFDLTLADPRWRPPYWRADGRLREIARAREIFCDALLGGREYKSSLADIDRYLFHFALMARRKM